MTPAHHWRERLRQGLLSARKLRDTARIAALRSALSAIDNAETPAAVHLATLPDGPIAGAACGLGSTEADRRVLTDAEIRDLIQTEIDERLQAADEYIVNGYHGRASDLRSQAAVLAQALRDV
ncbi:glutamyl-tRNA amidotransferase [Mycolicibacterium sp.]|uniref:glutamyl-tRNA amidotransferase n=1 Tax=Mycolicibacterium sp. TaxID=2320850 RepID=UPI0037CA170A